MKANESKAFYLSGVEAFKDRKQFVHNLGDLLSQAREDVVSCVLDDDNIVTINFKNGFKKVNVEMDSYIAIIRDVLKRI